jgi:hypothetical protein
MEGKMPITKENPIVTPASEQKTYNVWWVENLSLDATLTASPEPILVVDYRLCYLKEDGTPEFHPTEIRRLHMRDLFTYMISNPDTASAVWGDVEVLGNVGKAQGILD